MANKYNISVEITTKDEMTIIDLMDYFCALLLDSDITMPFDPQTIILKKDNYNSIIYG